VIQSFQGDRKPIIKAHLKRIQNFHGIFKRENSGGAQRKWVVLFEVTSVGKCLESLKRQGEGEQHLDVGGGKVPMRNR
jgi:hypothetical protein